MKMDNGELFCMLDACKNLQSLDTNLLSSVNSIDTQYFSIYSKGWKNLKKLVIKQAKGLPSEKLSTTAVLCNCLQHFKFLEVLALMFGLLNAEVAQTLVEGLKHCRDLQVLDLSFNEIGPIEVKIIAAGLTNCPSLEELYLNDNCIGNDGAKILPSYIQRCYNLRVLDLDNNDIESKSLKSFTTIIST